MAARIIQTFRGFSGSEVYLMHKHGQLFVRKVGNIQRNWERLTHLARLVPVPCVYGLHDHGLDMEYIHGTDMRSWLISNPAKPLLDFLLAVLGDLDTGHHACDRAAQYHDWLDSWQVWPFAIDRVEFEQRLPLDVTATEYIGDLTLENIIATDRGFVLIDCQTSIWNSIIYDIAKLRQDLESHWFLRSKAAMLENKLSYIQRGLLEQWPQANNNALVALMLMRVLRYCQPHSMEYGFLLKEINRLCK